VKWFSHYLLGQYDAALSWAREELYLNPNQLQALAIRTAALAQLGGLRKRKNAAEVLLSNYPSLTVERMLRHLHWKARVTSPLPRGPFEGRHPVR